MTTITGNLLKRKITLSGNTKKDAAKVSQFMLDILKRHRNIWRKELDQWQSARLTRYALENPSNWLLQEVYDDIMLDGLLTGITENRTYRSTNKDYIIVDENGIKQDKETAFITKKSWFEDFIRYAHETAYYGTGVIFLNNVQNGEIKSVQLVPRGNVIPETKTIVTGTDGTSGFSYSDFPNYLIEVQMYNALGLLEKAAPYTILKRHSWASWDEFEELFGIPIRIAKIASQSDDVKKEVASWLEEMGSSTYGVFPLGTEVEIKENSKSDAFQVFFQKLQALNDELSILVLHQTMTTQNGSSKSQGEVHENTLKELVYSDEKKILAILNDKLLPAMRFFGYAIPENYKIAVSQTKDPEKQMLIDDMLLRNGYILKQSYLEDTYGSEIEHTPTPGTPQKQGKP
ncbi:phage portal protein family protein [Riemerella columbipharyngis]|uniref:Mu-like prophage protein gp29 n=1 Tax=Riemerella columbipharyngis TaxID=1071918 RepID=A0A1G7FLH3_9FLAO|nr:DUF935 family protein [Riemerella columbipharyngis]SDE76684.1 Protein of unknown function [Riemerella columbipharyngis]